MIFHQIYIFAIQEVGNHIHKEQQETLLNQVIMEGKSIANLVPIGTIVKTYQYTSHIVKKGELILKARIKQQIKIR